MITFKEFFECREYTGKSLEAGGTAINNPPSKLIKSMLLSHIKKGDKVLDYGCGKGRHTKLLRNEGITVYAYDPFLSPKLEKGDGWKLYTDKKPTNKDFDVGFSTLVFNVMKQSEEREAITFMNGKCKKQVHLVRNYEVCDDLKSFIKKGTNKFVYDFFINNYAKDNVDLQNKFKASWGKKIIKLNEEELLDYCCFGIHTGPKSFQRIPNLAEMGFTIDKKFTKGTKPKQTVWVKG